MQATQLPYWIAIMQALGPTIVSAAIGGFAWYIAWVDGEQPRRNERKTYLRNVSVSSRLHDIPGRNRTAWQTFKGCVAALRELHHRCDVPI